jgi:hypothetical protein
MEQIVRIEIELLESGAQNCSKQFMRFWFCQD